MYHLQNKSVISHYLQPLFITKALSNPQIFEAGYALEGYKWTAMIVGNHSFLQAPKNKRNIELSYFNLRHAGIHHSLE